MPGDGIGPDVVAEAVRALDAVVPRAGGFKRAHEELPVGTGEYMRKGDPLPVGAHDLN